MLAGFQVSVSPKSKVEVPSILIIQPQKLESDFCHKTEGSNGEDLDPTIPWKECSGYIRVRDDRYSYSHY